MNPQKPAAAGWRKPPRHTCHASALNCRSNHWLRAKECVFIHSSSWGPHWPAATMGNVCACAGRLPKATTNCSKAYRTSTTSSSGRSSGERHHGGDFSQSDPLLSFDMPEWPVPAGDCQGPSEPTCRTKAAALHDSQDLSYTNTSSSLHPPSSLSSSLLHSSLPEKVGTYMHAAQAPHAPTTPPAHPQPGRSP